MTTLPKNIVIITKCDSGATSHFVRQANVSYLKDITSSDGSDINLPDNLALKATQQGTIPLSSSLSTCAKTASIVPGLVNTSFLSTPQLLDDGCQVLFEKDKMSRLF